MVLINSITLSQGIATSSKERNKNQNQGDRDDLQWPQERGYQKEGEQADSQEGV